MKKLIAGILFFFTVITVAAQDLKTQIGTIVTAYANLHTFNGSVFVSKRSMVLINKGYGYRNADSKVLNDGNTVYQIGSITKQFTAAVILKLQQEKKLSVQDKLSKYFPGYPKGDSITIQQLLTHTSGIYNYTDNGEFMANSTTTPSDRKRMMALFKDKPLGFSPGTGWGYSNSGYALLGYIIEAITKKPYEQMVRQYIFTPLKMTHSGFDFTHLKNPYNATGYFSLDGAKAVPAFIVDSTVSFSAGAIYSTTGDLYLWHKALETNTVLSKAQQEQAYTPVKNNYGYGWNIDSIEGKRRVSHSGGIPGFITHISRVPTDDVCIILLSNASDKSLDDITKAIFNLLNNKPYQLPKAKNVITLPEATLLQYQGEYEIRPDLHVVISLKNGVLVALPTGQAEAALYAEKEDNFFVKEPAIQLEFKRNNVNEITSFILHQGGANVDCKKIK